MTPCPQCRMPLPPGATSCPNCGTFTGAPHGYAQPPTPPGYAPPGYAPPGYAPPGYPPAGLPPPAASGDGGAGLKVLGGCGLAGCLGAVLAGVAVVGVIVALVLIGSSSSSSGPTASGRSGALPASGSLRDLVRPTVGGFSLISTASVTKLGDRISPGVVDSLGAFYRSPDGSQLTQILLIYPSPDVAEQRMQAVFDVALQTLEPGQKLTRGEIRNSEGALLGSSLAITGGALEHVYWSNGKLLTFATATPPNAVDYQAASPY